MCGWLFATTVVILIENILSLQIAIAIGIDVFLNTDFSPI
jgi:hypothetical protein